MGTPQSCCSTMGKVEARVRRCSSQRVIQYLRSTTVVAHQVDSPEDLDDLVALHLLSDELCVLDFRR